VVPDAVHGQLWLCLPKRVRTVCRRLAGADSGWLLFLGVAAFLPLVYVAGYPLAYHPLFPDKAVLR
jgi:hypothetical protein